MKYYRIGQLMAMSILQQGSGFPYMAQPVYDYISGVELSDVSLSIEDIPSFELRTIVEKVWIVGYKNVC